MMRDCLFVYQNLKDDSFNKFDSPLYTRKKGKSRISRLDQNWVTQAIGIRAVTGGNLTVVMTSHQLMFWKVKVLPKHSV